jgi:hypothetical protein
MRLELDGDFAGRSIFFEDFAENGVLAFLALEGQGASQ